MKTASNKYQIRIYNESEVCFFRKTKEQFGGLSNMASGFPIQISSIKILSSEALYQSCRFPQMPDIQEKIILEKSPMSAKMVSKPYRNLSREDWDDVRIDIMYWCLRVKLAQNFLTFGRLLESTHDLPIIEDSTKDDFWGAIRDKNDSTKMIGVNALGRLLMKLRLEYNSEKRFDLLYVEPLRIPNFLIFGQSVPIIDERKNFISSLVNRWGLDVQAPSKTIKKYALEDSFVKTPITEYKSIPIKTPKKAKIVKSRKRETLQTQALLFS